MTSFIHLWFISGVPELICQCLSFLMASSVFFLHLSAADVSRIWTRSNMDQSPGLQRPLTAQTEQTEELYKGDLFNWRVFIWSCKYVWIVLVLERSINSVVSLCFVSDWGTSANPAAFTILLLLCVSTVNPVLTLASAWRVMHKIKIFLLSDILICRSSRKQRLFLVQEGNTAGEKRRKKKSFLLSDLSCW